MFFFKNIIKKTAEKLENSIKRFPEALLISTAMAVTAIILNHLEYNRHDTQKILEHVMMVFSLGFPLFVGIRLIFERFKTSRARRGITDMLAAAALIGYYFIIPEDVDDTFMFRFAALLISLYLAAASTAYFFRRKNYSVYVMHLITKFFVTFLYSCVLYFGISAIIFTVDKLFSLSAGSKIYGDILFLVAGLFGAPYFLGSIPPYEKEMETEDFNKVFRTLFLFIVMPLISVYTVILHAYFAKILILWQWPKSLVGNLVLWYGIIGTSVIFFVHALSEESRWAKQFLKFFPASVMIPIGMMFFAVWIRVSEYGITVPRYCVIAAGIWVLANMLYHIFSKKYQSIVVVLTAVIVLLVSAYSPFNAHSVSVWNQNNRFEALLDEYGMLKDNKIVKPAKALSDSQKKAVLEVIRYFSNNHKLSDLKLLPKGFTLNEMKDVFGFEYDYSAIPNEYVSYYFDRNMSLFDISKYDYMLDFNQSLINSNQNLDYQSDKLRVTYKHQSKELAVLQNGQTIYTVNMEDIADKYQMKLQGKMPAKPEDIVITDQNGRVFAKFLIFSLNGQKTGENSIKADYMEAWILIKVK